MVRSAPHTTLGRGYPFALVTTLPEFVAQALELGRRTHETERGPSLERADNRLP